MKNLLSLGDELTVQDLCDIQDSAQPHIHWNIDLRKTLQRIADRQSQQRESARPQRDHLELPSCP